MSLFRVNHDAIPAAVRRCALTIGNFDGVHLGHQTILRDLCERAKRLGLPSVVATFDPPPALLIRPDYRPVFLSTLAQRAELLHAFGVDHVVILETTRELLNLEAQEFFQKILVEQFQVRAMVEGANFQFGKNRRGTPELLRRWGEEAEIEISIVADQDLSGITISSSAIRQAVSVGAVDLAATMLGRPYSITGSVEHGLKRGRTIGFPTANLAGMEVLIPGMGVYAGQATVAGRPYAAAIHIGPNVSFHETENKVECHLLHFSGDLYGRSLTVNFISKLRDVTKFASVGELVAQMEFDVARTAEIVSNSRILLQNF